MLSFQVSNRQVPGPGEGALPQQPRGEPGADQRLHGALPARRPQPLPHAAARPHVQQRPPGLRQRIGVWKYVRFVFEPNLHHNLQSREAG